MDVFVNNLQQKKDVDLTALHQTAVCILSALSCDASCELSIALVDDQEMHRLNHQYRGINRPTDVLSFAFQESDEPRSSEEDDRPLMLGDVILSTETTQRQAQEQGHSFEKELYFLLIHGILHLLGYDHHTDEEAKNMEELEQRLLTHLDIS